MEHFEDQFQAKEGHNIYYQLWEPAQRVNAVVMICHGVAEHGGRYLGLAHYLTDRGYAVAALDLPGHGRSSGARGHVDRFSDFVEAVEQVRERLRKRFPEQQVFLLGHSMGGLVSALYLLKYQQKLAGCLLSGAAIQSDATPGMLQLLLIRGLSALLPKLPVLQLDGSAVSRDAEVVKAYYDDELVFNGRLSARLVSELFNALNELAEKWQAISLPILIMHGGADSLTSPIGSENFYHAISSNDKQLKLYPNLFHEILNEPEKEQVMADIQEWLTPRVGVGQQ